MILYIHHTEGVDSGPEAWPRDRGEDPLNLEQAFPRLYGNRHGYVKNLDVPEYARRMSELTALDRYFRVEFSGLENIPQHGGALVVGNHGPLGLDAPFIMKHFYEDAGRVVRPLADRFIFKLPVFRVLVNTMGILEGEPEQAVEVLKSGEICSVYPGGYSETIKTADQKYQVKPFWKNRFGFIKVALRAQVPILPVACVGIDDIAYQVLDADQTQKFPPARVVQKFMNHEKYKVPLWLGLGAIPLPMKLSYKVGAPIHLGYGPEEAKNYELMLELKEKIADELESMLQTGLEERQAQRREVLERAVRRAPRLAGGMKKAAGLSRRAGAFLARS